MWEDRAAVHGAGAAVAAPDVYDLAFFQGISEFSANYQQRNAALKWFRQIMEDDEEGEDTFRRFDNREPVAVAMIIKDKGMDYDFHETRSRAWHWFELVSQLTDESMAFVVDGPDHRSGGVTGCYFAPRPKSYDHKRHHQLKEAGFPFQDAKLRVWDFVIQRADGSAVRLHPQWSNTTVETYAVEGHAHEVRPPVNGIGSSDGRGTYKWYKELGTQRKLKFDGQKRPR